MTKDWRTPRISRRYLLLLMSMLALLAFVTTASGTLAGSNFDAFDGNLVLDDNADNVNDDVKDWENVSINCTSTPKVGCALDKATGTTDDSFGMGTSENDDPPSVVSGQIPNNKSDLTRFYVASEKASGDDFLYLAWERVQEPTGTTNMDFEFNQNYCDPNEATPPAQNVCSSNGVTPTRKQGDLLIKYDLSQGGVNPSLGYHLWETAAGNLTKTTPQQIASVCQAGNKFPCWGKENSLAGNFEGAVNTNSVTDPINPDAPRTLSPRTFGEAGINLTDSNLFPAGQCKNFGSAYLKSRSSDAFTAEIKDFIAPIHVNISNCGKIELVKDFVSAPSSARANLVIKNSDNTVTVDSESNAADNGTTGENTVFAGNYNISETAGSNTDFANYSTSVACIDEANSNAAVTVSSQVLTGTTRSGSVPVAVASDIKCTFTNTLLTGAIKVTKTGKDKNCTGAGTPSIGTRGTCKAASDAFLANAKFEIWKETNSTTGLQTSGGTPDTKVKNEQTTGAGGTTCFDGLTFQSYYVLETQAPSGYDIDDTDAGTAGKQAFKSASVSASASCAPTGTLASASFTDTPLSKITIAFESKVASGVTLATISCSNPSVSEENLVQGTPKVLDNLLPDTTTGYTCTVKIDP